MAQAAQEDAVPGDNAVLLEILRRGPGVAPAGAPVRERAGGASPVVPRAGNGEMIEALAAAVERLRARVAEDGQVPPPAQPAPPRHKHSMSLIGRWRLARKQRRGR